MLNVPANPLEQPPETIGNDAAVVNGHRQRARSKVSEVSAALKEAEDLSRLDGWEMEMTELCLGHASLKPLEVMDRVRLATEIALLKRKIVREVRTAKRRNRAQTKEKPQTGSA